MMLSYHPHLDPLPGRERKENFVRQNLSIPRSLVSRVPFIQPPREEEEGVKSFVDK